MKRRRSRRSIDVTTGSNRSNGSATFSRAMSTSPSPLLSGRSDSMSTGAGAPATGPPSRVASSPRASRALSAPNGYSFARFLRAASPFLLDSSITVATLFVRSYGMRRLQGTASPAFLRSCRFSSRCFASNARLRASSFATAAARPSHTARVLTISDFKSSSAGSASTSSSLICRSIFSILE